MRLLLQEIVLQTLVDGGLDAVGVVERRVPAVRVVVQPVLCSIIITGACNSTILLHKFNFKQSMSNSQRREIRAIKTERNGAN